jgi:hypothetical protein
MIAFGQNPQGNSAALAGAKAPPEILIIPLKGRPQIDRIAVFSVLGEIDLTG